MKPTVSKKTKWNQRFQKQKKVKPTLIGEFISIKPVLSTIVCSPPRQLGYSGTREDFGSLISWKNWICVAVQTLKSKHEKSWLLGGIIVGYIAGLDILLWVAPTIGLFK